MPLIKPTATCVLPRATLHNSATTTPTTTATTAETALAKSVPATPLHPKPPMHYVPSSPDVDYGAALNNCAPHSYPNFSLDISDHDSRINEQGLDEDSSLAMITPPPPYDTPHIRAAAAQQMPAPRKFRFNNRELFNISCSASHAGAPSSHIASAITPTKLSAAAAAMFAAPPMAQLNRKWTNLHRKRRRRNSSSGDSKELDRLVLQSVDWDDNDIY